MIVSPLSDILILNLPTKNYESPNNKQYQQKITNFPSIKLSQTNKKNNYKSTNNKTKNLPTIYKSPNEKLQICQQLNSPK